ncbi:MAG TPA: tryptophan 2,3-dioxygenase family protein [Saprospiraceae bacterium]|nr:tryptophan 2,3-dioxygenase family protein [Saprospiraceae bacterium]
MSDQKKYASIHYSSYLGLEKILDAQHPRSKALGKEAHEETLFIIIHQVYELWFKQILHEVDSVMTLFRSNHVDERNIDIAVSRLERVNEIMRLLIQQIKVLETMTPLDFLDFRSYLFPASGFQSFQFRKLEVMLGLKIEKRISYTPYRYYHEFSQEQQDEIVRLENSESLFNLVESWLERTPFLDVQDFDFKTKYMAAVQHMLQRERQAIQDSDYLSEQEKTMRLKMNGDTDTYFANIFNQDFHDQQIAEGRMRLSFKATMAALLIQLYGNEPLLQLPYRLLNVITEMDELLTSWRYRHAQMVMRMLGRKSGTGGSSGHEYLMETVRKHQIFIDFHNISTLLIPRSELPELPQEMKRTLGFYFNHIP